MSGKKKNGAGNRPAGAPADDAGTSAAYLSQRYRVPQVDLAEYEITAEILALLPQEICERRTVIPVSRAGGSLIVAMVDPMDADTIDELKRLTGLNIEPVVASDEEIRTAIAKYHGRPR